MTHNTRDTAVDAMMQLKKETLQSIVCSASQELYGHVPSATDFMTVPELVSWWIWHYEFNETTQEWELCEQDRFWKSGASDLSDAADEAEYYRSFG